MATYVSNRDSAGKTDEKGHYKFLSSAYVGNVVSGQQVSQNSPTGMSVRVSAGDIRIPYSNYSYMGWSEGFTGVSITTADPSNPRIDRVVAYIDRSMTFLSTDVNNPQSLKYMAVPGTPNAVPSKTSDAATQSAVGSINPWVEIGVVRVAASATVILDANITDTRVFVSLNVTQTPPDWNLLTTVPTVSNNYGQKEHKITFPNVDYTGLIGNGTKLKIPRTIAPPTQCFQFVVGGGGYLSRSSPTGITFTDDFTCEAMIYIGSYASGGMTIISRTDGSTGGWKFDVDQFGTVRLIGYSGSTSTLKYVQSYQSVPLNKWVHIAASLDMSGWTTATNKIYIDGVDVPVYLTQGGTPTSLNQVGNLQIGADANNNKFGGLMCQVRLWSTVRTAQQIRDNAHQELVGNETGLVSYFRGNGNFNDSNTTNANNLTSSGSVIATWPQNPFTLNEYAIATNVALVSGNTEVTIFGGYGFVPNTTLGNVSYSVLRAPFGFPSSRTRWRIETIKNQAETIAIGATGTWWASNHILSCPVGEWRRGHKGNYTQLSSASGTRRAYYNVSFQGLATTIDKLAVYTESYAGTTYMEASFYAEDEVTVFSTQSKFILYGQIVTATGTESYSISAHIPSVIWAECAYI